MSLSTGDCGLAKRLVRSAERWQCQVNAIQETRRYLTVQRAGGECAHDTGDGDVNLAPVGETSEIRRILSPQGSGIHAPQATYTSLSASMEVAETLAGESYGSAGVAFGLNRSAKLYRQAASKGWGSTPDL